MRRFLPIGVVILSACGSANQVANSTNPSSSTKASMPSVKSPAELLFAVLEARGAQGRMGPEPGVQDAHDRVAIVGVDGIARARADFMPRPMPVVGNAAPVLAPEATVSSGHVFYLDGNGALRELTAGGSRQLASFGLKQQQEISFAVSPDRGHIEASRFTFPPVNPNPTSPGNIFLSDNYGYELLAADAGGATRTIRSSNGGESSVTQQPFVIGWDDPGPIAVTGWQFGTQNGTQGRVLWGHGTHLSASGQPASPLGGADCSLISIVRNGILCMDEQTIRYSARTGDGQTLWSLPPPSGQNYYSYLELSPDATRIAYTGGVRGRDGSNLILPANFRPEGWLDSGTLIGVTGENEGQEMAVVRLSSPNQVDDLGFKGEFIGVVQAP